MALSPAAFGACRRWRPLGNTLDVLRSNKSYFALRRPHGSVDHIVIGDTCGFCARRYERPIACPFHSAYLFQPIQFPKRIWMVIDPYIQRRPFLMSVNDQSRGLLSSNVAASRFSCLHGGDQAWGESHMGILEIRISRPFKDLCPCQH